MEGVAPFAARISAAIVPVLKNLRLSILTERSFPVARLPIDCQMAG
jgi:hypothetical protein